MKWLASKKGMEPEEWSAYEDFMDDAALKADSNVALFGEQLKSTQAQPAISTWSELGEALNATLEKLTTGGMTPQDAADAMQADAERIGTGS